MAIAGRGTSVAVVNARGLLWGTLLWAVGCSGPTPEPAAPPPAAASPAPAPEPELASAAAAADALFAPLVSSDASWELIDGEGDRIAVELRRYQVEGITIARLSWTYHPVKGPPRSEIGSVPVVIAVGPSGVDLHESADDLDDDAVLTLLADGADLSDPPEQRESGTSYAGRVVQTARGPITCFGQEPPDDSSFECPDTCYGQLCWSASDGPVRLNGRWAPGDKHFTQAGYEE